MTVAATKEDIKPRPWVKCAGGKSKLVPILMDYFVSYKTYHEPFVGGGALFFALQPNRAVLADLNAKLIDAYVSVRDNVDAVIQRLKTYENDEDMFYETRKNNFMIGDRAQRAAEYIYVNKVCFNGLYRVNAEGQFNVPFGRYTNPKICDEKNLRACSAALQAVTLNCAPFELTIPQAKAGDALYADPPYHPISETSSFTKYTRDGFTEADQRELAKLLLDAKKRGVRVIASNSDCKLIREIYPKKDWNIRKIEAARSINSVGDGRGKITELLIT